MPRGALRPGSRGAVTISPRRPPSAGTPTAVWARGTASSPAGLRNASRAALVYALISTRVAAAGSIANRMPTSVSTRVRMPASSARNDSSWSANRAATCGSRSASSSSSALMRHQRRSSRGSAMTAATIAAMVSGAMTPSRTGSSGRCSTAASRLRMRVRISRSVRARNSDSFDSKFE